MNILCTICGRKGSKEIPNKNLSLFLKKPLVWYTIKQAKECNIFTKIVISSDSDKILKIGKKFKLDLMIKRPNNLCTDNMSKLKAIKHAFQYSENFFKIKFDHIIDLDITAPLRTVLDIKKVYKKIKNKKRCNIISISASKKNPYFNMVSLNKKRIKLVKNKKNKNYFSRQKAPKTFDIDPSVNAWTRKSILETNHIINSNTTYNIIPNNRSMDIDSKLDFKIVEFLYKINKK